MCLDWGNIFLFFLLLSAAGAVLSPRCCVYIMYLRQLEVEVSPCYPCVNSVNSCVRECRSIVIYWFLHGREMGAVIKLQSYT